MIGLDTNVLVRYIVRDDAKQTAAATRLIESQCTAETPGFVSQLVLAELFWVLSRGYEYPKSVRVEVFTKLLGSAELEVEDAADAWVALRAFAAGPADFADLLIGLRGRSAGCETIFTFDKSAVKSGFHTLLP
ncbi:MAG: type II toxin-antitoxin system VapC family toxin [Gammaproteobacteria bacterium]|nr:type II toxin-antitoxin system VapC family toxin [Gammaproteobacteria bacterium]